MGQIDWAILINWIVSGFIGLVFGILGGWVTYRRDRIRDDIAWQREKQQFQEDWQRQKELLEIQFDQRLKELELQFSREENERLRNTLLKGVDNPIATIGNLQRARVELQRVELQMEYLVERAAMFVPESRTMDYLKSMELVLRELQAKLVQEEDLSLGMKALEQMKMLKGTSEEDPSKLIEDMRHNVVWHHHDSNDAKGSTWSAIAAEAGRFNYDYKFLVYFLKSKNDNNGWQIPGTPYEPVPIPSVQEFIDILRVRLEHIKRVIDSNDLSLKWEWPSGWGHVPWNGPIINTDTLPKLSDEAYFYMAQKEYAQTKVAISQYLALLGE